jgi:phosphopantothenoylcysteine synthetase/decarboxylase
MHILVTGGNTQAPIDQVRCITNIFTGRTGAAIALHARGCGHAVTVLTSRSEAFADLAAAPPGPGWALVPYRTFDDLNEMMAGSVRGGALDAIIHCAAVSDYLPAGVYAPAAGTRFESATGHWIAVAAEPPALLDHSAPKVKSDEPELWLRLRQAPKLIDRVRADWGFRGVLVKFKLEVDVTTDRLLEIAESSRRHSHADLMVANTPEGAGASTWIGPLDGRYENIARSDLPRRLLDAVEQLHQLPQSEREARRG